MVLPSLRTNFIFVESTMNSIPLMVIFLTNDLFVAVFLSGGAFFSFDRVVVFTSLFPLRFFLYFIPSTIINDLFLLDI